MLQDHTPLLRRLLAAGYFCSLLCGFSVAVAADPPPAPLMIKARGKEGEKPKKYETRILAHLGDFHPAAVEYDKYGGWIGERFEATGFFHPKKIGPRWWLIDPEGYRFLHVAVNAVGAGSSPQMKKALPLKFGDRDHWRDATISLLRQHGFNGTGSWSEDERNAAGPRRLVYTPICNFLAGYGHERGGLTQEPGHFGYPNRCIFVFDPAFETFCEKHARSLAKLKDDPYLLGYFSDNELPFPKDSLDRFLSLDAKDPGCRAAKAWLEKRKDKADKKKITDEDREAWLGFLVDRYLGVVARAIRKYDPHHLFLGSRFHGSELQVAAVWRAAGKHLDVVAANVYRVWTPQPEKFRRWAEWSGRPILVTEWYAKGDDSGMANKTGAGWTVPTQRDRGWFYQNYTLGLLQSQVCVGWHWFKYIDNDPTDKRTDPSNRDSNKGIVNVRYEPYQPLLDAMRDLNRAAYPLTQYFDTSPTR